MIWSCWYMTPIHNQLYSEIKGTRGCSKFCSGCWQKFQVVLSVRRAALALGAKRRYNQIYQKNLKKCFCCGLLSKANPKGPEKRGRIFKNMAIFVKTLSYSTIASVCSMASIWKVFMILNDGWKQHPVDFNVFSFPKEKSNLLLALLNLNGLFVESFMQAMQFLKI